MSFESHQEYYVVGKSQECWDKLRNYFESPEMLGTKFESPKDFRVFLKGLDPEDVGRLLKDLDISPEYQQHMIDDINRIQSEIE